MWFLAPPRPAPACRVWCPSRRCSARSAWNPRSDGDVRVLQDGVDRDLVPVHHVEDAFRQPGFLQQLGQVDRCGRILFDGFRMKVFPQAMALANIHIGTMAGKLNGVTPATTPSGWRIW